MEEAGLKEGEASSHGGDHRWMEEAGLKEGENFDTKVRMHDDYACSFFDVIMMLVS